MPDAARAGRRPPRRWKAREVVRDIGHQPRLFTRLTLTGGHFPHRSLAPFVRVGSVVTASVEIDDDELSARAYFAQPLPSTGEVEFGYGHEVAMRFPRQFSQDRVQQLDRARLPEDIHG